MRWAGQRESSNVEDRRGMGMPLVACGGFDRSFCCPRDGPDIGRPQLELQTLFLGEPCDETGVDCPRPAAQPMLEVADD